MKYTVEGFSQKCLIEYGLDEKDALILRYFIDFKDSGKMKMKIINKVPYYWLKGAALLEQLPILRINSVDVLRRRLKKMTSCGVLRHEHVLEGGSYAFYTVGENYENLLLYDHMSEDHISDHGDIIDIEDTENNIEEIEMLNIKCVETSENNNRMTENTETISEKTSILTQKTEGMTEKKEHLSEKSKDSDYMVGTKDYSINKSINNNQSSCDLTQEGTLKLQENGSGGKRKSSRSNKKLSVPYDEIVKMFNDVCISFPKVKVRNKTRDNLIKKMYKNLGINMIKAVFEMAEKSDYLSGRNGKWLNCSFDWIIKENNYIKVLEGNYNRHKEVKADSNAKTGYCDNIENSESHGVLEWEDENESEIIINTELLEDL